MSATAEIGLETGLGAVTAGSTIPSTVAARLIRTKQRPTNTAVPLAAIPHRAGRQMHGRIKLSEAAANRRAAWTVAVGNRQEAWTGAAAEVAAIALATEVYRRAPV